MKKVVVSVFLLSVVLFFSFSSKNLTKETDKKSVVAATQDLSVYVSQLKSKISQKGGTITSETFYPGDGERRLLWQGGVTYCGGQCFAVVSVTGSCLFGSCWGFGATSAGDKECPCEVN